MPGGGGAAHGRGLHVDVLSGAGASGVSGRPASLGGWSTVLAYTSW